MYSEVARAQAATEDRSIRRERHESSRSSLVHKRLISHTANKRRKENDYEEEITMSHVAHEEALIQKIRTLPPEKLVEVEDFVDFLRQREDDCRLTKAAAQLAEDSLRVVWDNDEDAAYDQL